MSWTKTRSEIALHKRRFPDEDIPVELYQRYKAEKLAAYVEKVVSEAPPLTPEQADKIAALLRGSACGR